MRCWAFGVDETLVISNGPVTLESMEELRQQGDIVGICGNMHVFCQLPDWHKRVSFLGQSFLSKDYFLHGLKLNIRADDYIMVGNIGEACSKQFGLPQSGSSEDMSHALRAAWRFISEKDFAAGVR